jgi:hypothetical protein
MIAVRATTEADVEGLSALFEARFGHGLSLAAWSWKYRQLPGVARSMVAVDADGTVLAHGGALRLEARWLGGQGGIWQLVDFAGRSSGAGLRPPLVELGRQLLADLPAAGDAPWIFGFPSERHFRLGERVFGYRPLVHLTPLAGPLPQVPVAAVVAPVALAALEESALEGAAPADEALPRWQSGDWHLASGDACGAWAAAIWERCGVLGIRRTREFLNWRYWARPDRYYRFYRLRNGSDQGLAVFAFVGDQAWAAELWLPGGSDWYSPMLAVAADLRAAGLRSWRFWPLPQPGGAQDAAAAAGVVTGGAAIAASDGSGGAGTDAGLLRRLGLIGESERRFVGCRGAVGAADPAPAASGFYYAMGDYDLA